MRRAAVGLAFLAILAGCGATGGSADAGRPPAETATVTPVPVPAGTTGDRAEVPPGLVGERLVDPDALVSAHASILSNTSYTARERVVERYRNGTLRVRHTSVVRRTDSKASYRLERVDRDDRTNASLRVERWSDGRDLYTATTRGNETTYSHVTTRVRAKRPTVGSGIPGDAWSLRRLFGLLPVASGGTTERDGEIRYRLGTPRPGDIVPLRNVTFVALVAPSGLVTEYRVSYDVDRQRVATRVSVRVSVEEIGTTTVTRPGWYRTAHNATGAG